MFFALIAEIGPARATVITYVNPAVAVLLGVLLLDERFTLGMAIGFPLILRRLGAGHAPSRGTASSAAVPEARSRPSRSCASPSRPDQSMRTSP